MTGDERQGTVRQPAVAGAFYAGNPRDLTVEMDGLFAAAESDRDNFTADEKFPKALVAPHAGYMYSGEIAALAYARLAASPALKGIEKVVLLGPSHFVYTPYLSASAAAAYRTPLGDVEVDQEGIARAAAAMPFVDYNDSAHAREHCIEVHLPFLQRILGKFRILPFVTSGASYEQVSELIEYFWGYDDAIVIVSTDLSHYHDYETARALDEALAAAVLKLEYESITEEQACGQVLLKGLLRVARQKRMKAAKIAQINSGDVSGDKSRVVGYGAFVIN